MHATHHGRKCNGNDQANTGLLSKVMRFFPVNHERVASMRRKRSQLLKFLTYNVLLILVPIFSWATTFGSLSTANIRISNIKVIPLHDGINSVEFWGLQDQFKGPSTSSGLSESIYHNSGIITQVYSDPGSIANYRMYFALVGPNEAYAIYYPALRTYTLQNLGEGSEHPSTSILFFDDMLKNHIQTFVIYVNRHAVGDTPSESEVSVFYFMPGLLSSDGRLLSGPSFQLLKSYKTSYVCSNSDFVISKELSVPLPNFYFKRFHCKYGDNVCGHC